MLLVFGPSLNVGLELLTNIVFARVHQFLGELVDDELLLTVVLVWGWLHVGLHIRLHVGLLSVLGLASTVHTHGLL